MWDCSTILWENYNIMIRKAISKLISVLSLLRIFYNLQRYLAAVTTGIFATGISHGLVLTMNLSGDLFIVINPLIKMLGIRSNGQLSHLAARNASPTITLCLMGWHRRMPDVRRNPVCKVLVLCRSFHESNRFRKIRQKSWRWGVEWLNIPQNFRLRALFTNLTVANRYSILFSLFSWSEIVVPLCSLYALLGTIKYFLNENGREHCAVLVSLVWCQLFPLRTEN